MVGSGRGDGARYDCVHDDLHGEKSTEGWSYIQPMESCEGKERERERKVRGSNLLYHPIW